MEINRVTIYGYSDDLIEVEGDLNEEFGCFCDNKHLLFSDGTKINVVYDDNGFWKLALLEQQNIDIINHSIATGCDNYSDRLTMEGNFIWVECWPIDGIDHEEINEQLKECNFREFLNNDELLSLWRKMKGHM